MKFTDLNRYDYALPDELIRRVPVEPRDSARLFVYDTATDTITLDVFRNVAQHLPARTLMVLNNTRVVPARLWLKKVTGGKIEVLVLVNEWDEKELIPALVDRKISVGDQLTFPDGSKLIAMEHKEQKFIFRLESAKTLETLLEQYGTTPLPHYLEGDKKYAEAELRERYQTVFAAAGASVAAPTASLHFTEHVFKSLQMRQIDTAWITLNVGLGTFAPLREENFLTRKLHREYVDVSDTVRLKLTDAKSQEQPILSVGTTTTRTLEALALTKPPEPFTQVDLFIFPPYQFQMVDMLMTNFHLPKTSLLLLVEAFLHAKGAKRGVLDLYREAIQANFSFYSFGDSMLIL